MSQLVFFPKKGRKNVGRKAPAKHKQQALPIFSLVANCTNSFLLILGALLSAFEAKYVNSWGVKTEHPREGVLL